LGVEEDDDQKALGVEEDQDQAAFTRVEEEQEEEDQAAFGVERSKQRKLDMELDTQLKIKQNLGVGDGAHIILS
jgi:hypothetical protein